MISLTIGAALALASYTPSETREPRPIMLQPCRVEGIAEEARCGVFEVRENRTDPRSRILPLRVVVLPAKNPQAAAEPVFYFEGGPGSPAMDSAGYMADAWFRQNNDVVLIDQRGSGPGHRLSCDLPGSGDDLRGYVQEPYAAFAQCGRTLGESHDLTQYTTPVAMQDADDVRRALGYGKVNLYGASYGSRAAIVFTKLFPEHVRSVYLSGVVPLEIRMPVYFPWSAQRAVDATLATCTADPACRERYPNSKAALQLVTQRLQAAPARVTVTNPETGAAEEVSLSHWGFATALLAKLYTVGSPSDLPETIRRAQAGDYRELVEAWIKRSHEQRESSFAWGLNKTVNCLEDVSRLRPGEVERESNNTFFGASLGLGALELCRAWPQATYPEGFFEPFQSSIPVMITSGEYDPVTPPHWGEVARRSFRNSFHLVTLQGHSNFREDGCLGAVAGEFLRRGTTEGLDLSCVYASDSGLQLIP